VLMHTGVEHQAAVPFLLARRGMAVEEQPLAHLALQSHHLQAAHPKNWTRLCALLGGMEVGRQHLDMPVEAEPQAQATFRPAYEHPSSLYIHTCTKEVDVKMNMHIHLHMYMYTQTYVYICRHTLTLINVHIYTNVYVYMYMCIYESIIYLYA